jgi:TRAP-type mannitol/chloroaromatic compound transport system permease small subunit
MAFIIKNLDHISHLLGGVAQVLVMILVSSMMYEVIARYVFDAPTLWAFDISYMLNGTIFLLGAAYTLQADAHVRIDFLSTKLSKQVQQWINGIFYFFILGPIFSVFGKVATGKAWRAFTTAEVESVSPWAPLVWPFYSAIALGLVVFAVQFFVEGLKYMSGQKMPGAHQGEIEDLEDVL